MQDEVIAIGVDRTLARRDTEAAANLLGEAAPADRQRFAPFRLTSLRFRLESPRDPFVVDFCQVGNGRQFEQLGERNAVDDALAQPLFADLVVAAVGPVARMRYDSRSYHVQVDIGKAARQVCARLNGSRMVAILPICPAALFTPIELLRRAARNQL